MKSFRIFQILSILLIFILATIVHSQTTNSCGDECQYSIFDEKLSIKVNGDITKTNWDDCK